MSEVTTIGLDLAKNVFKIHGADEAGRAVIRKQLGRGQVLGFLGRFPRCVVARESSSGAHFRGSEIVRLGREVRLIPPTYVKLFLKRQSEASEETIR